MAMQLGGFVIRVLAWLPVAFVVWYFAAPVLLWPAVLLVIFRRSLDVKDPYRA